VSDTGIGIPQHEQQLIFDEFQQSQRTSGLGYGGLGLGLAICKRIVELHGGQITVQSSGVEGEGSAFTVRLPTAEVRALEQAPPPIRSSETTSPPVLLSDTRPYTLLVIDDEPALLDVTVRMLQSRGDGYHMVQAGGGRYGLEVLRTQPVDLVLLDLMMPEIDGFAVMRAMHDDPALRAIPILVMTAHVLSEAEIEQMTRSVTAILSKGVFSSEEILAHVDAALTGEQVIGGQTQRIVRRAMAYIHQHYADAITREDIAQHVAVDQSYLSRSFQRELGIPPMTYLSRYRIALARNKLIETDQTVMEIALDVGFSSDMAFSHAFRREMGVSPSAYRQQGRKRAP
ncbi:MAG: helix-turn-helix domain-containing protein, partial [Anaerolinea sp.]|nr:helix-turn-helix domain-containing protein [Anaerolinea sp.]